MVELTDLPNELIVQIYYNLGSIDDALHFGRSCQTLHNVLQTSELRQDIMKSIIMSSPTHLFDIQLCNLLALHNQLAQHFESGNGPIVVPHPRVERCLWEEKLFHSVSSSQDDIEDTQINDILARWQELRVLQDLFLSRHLTENDYLAPTRTDFRTLFRHLDILQDRGESETCLEGEVKRNFDVDQAARFYTAITGYWVYNEIRWCLSKIHYANGPGPFLSACSQILDLRIDNALLFRLDLLSIYEFLYQHLLPLHSRALADQPDTTRPLTFASHISGLPTAIDESKASAFRAFLFAGSSLLQPPDLIDLVIRDNLMRQRPYPVLHPPHSTLTYQRPKRPHIVANGNPLTATAVRSLSSALFRASFPGPTIQQINSNNLSDPHYAYLKWKILNICGKDARPNSNTLDSVFERRWKEECRYGVWWWACGNDKAECKMERWREEKRVRLRSGRNT